MYSVVLMTALASGGMTSGWCFHCHHYGYTCYGDGYGHGHGDHGAVGWDAYGYNWYGACYGSCYGDPYGYGSYYWGCYGGGWGYGGDHGGCHGLGYGYGYGSGYGYGGGYGAPPGGMPGTGTAPSPGGGSDVLPPPRPDDRDKKKETLLPTQARLIVQLPPDAKLYVDDQLTSGTSDPRSFHTPELEKGQDYYYVLRAEVIRDGKPVTETRRIIVRAGDVIRANFADLGASTATANAR